MGCCILIMALISQLFALRRRVRQAFGLPVGDWYEEAEQPGLFATLGARARRIARRGSTRAVLVAVVCAELTFAVIAAPGGHGLIAEHRLHARQAWEYARSFGRYADVSALWCTTTRTAKDARPAGP